MSSAVKVGLVPRNVAVSVEPPRITRYEVMTLAWQEVHHFLSQVADPLFFLAVQTGLRRSDLLGLQWRDVELPSGILSVQRALIKLPSGRTEVTAPKTGRGRVVALPAGSVEALSAHWERQLEAGRNVDFVFCGPRGIPVDPDMVTQTFRGMARRAGMDGFRFHDLRHTHASLLLAEGGHLKVVAERLGHSSMGITGDLYSHVAPPAQEDASKRFQAAWRMEVANRDLNRLGISNFVSGSGWRPVALADFKSIVPRDERGRWDRLPRTPAN